MKRNFIILATVIAITFVIWFVNFSIVKEGVLVPTNTTSTSNSTTSKGLANPASVNCEKVGGKLVINSRPDGGQYGLCYFEDNRACEEWALLRGDCPVGGMRTTGYDTIDQNFCAWSGGQTFAVPDSVCTFKNKSQCSTKSFYEGTCSPAQSAQPTQSNQSAQ